MEALMKAKRTDNGEWISGTGVTDHINVFNGPLDCLWCNYSWIPIDIKTLCFSTGFKVSGGVPVYNHDIILSIYSYCHPQKWRIFFNNVDHCWYAIDIEDPDNFDRLSNFNLEWFKVIGNNFNYKRK